MEVILKKSVFSVFQSALLVVDCQKWEPDRCYRMSLKWLFEYSTVRFSLTLSGDVKNVVDCITVFLIRQHFWGHD